MRLTTFWQTSSAATLVAPYCAIPRDYLSDTPLLRAMGFLVSQHGQLGAIPPPPFSQRFPLGEHAKWRCDTPPSKGVSQRYSRDTGYPMKTRQMGTIPPSAILSRKGIERYGGVSRTGPLRLQPACVGQGYQVEARDSTADPLRHPLRSHRIARQTHEDAR